MKLMTIIAGLLIAFGQLGADEGSPITALCFVSTPGDYIGQGKQHTYIQGRDGNFTINEQYRNSINIRFVGKYFLHPHTEWTLNFAPIEGGIIEPGIYVKAQRFPFQQKGHPGLDFSGCGRGSNTLKGEFEILEIEYDDLGEIEVFAANFIQNFDHPLFGSIRYNSTIPLEDEKFQTMLSDYFSDYDYQMDIIDDYQKKPEHHN